jgi:hypothetical protein
MATQPKKKTSTQVEEEAKKLLLSAARMKIPERAEEKVKEIRSLANRDVQLFDLDVEEEEIEKKRKLLLPTSMPSRPVATTPRSAPTPRAAPQTTSAVATAKNPAPTQESTSLWAWLNEKA